VTAYLLALASKESAAIVPVLLAASLAIRRDWKRLWAVAPLFAIAGVYAWGIAAAKSNHLHLNDGTFSLSAPVWLTLRNSIGRLLWVWGFLALALVWRKRMARWCLGWIALTFLPYSFLAYMPRVPSRHTYLASMGLAMLVGLAWSALAASRRLRAPGMAAVALVVCIANAGYLWTRKRAQFLERAEPTEQLRLLAERHRGAIHVRCFPYAAETAVLTLEMNGHDAKRLLFATESPGEPAADFCWSEQRKSTIAVATVARSPIP
jgi:hypothetical protein